MGAIPRSGKPREPVRWITTPTFACSNSTDSMGPVVLHNLDESEVDRSLPIRPATGGSLVSRIGRRCLTSVFHASTAQIHYEIQGAGSPLVFCHGMGGDLSQPKELVGSLPSHRLIVWDCRGHGETQSTADPGQFNFLTFAGDLRSLLDHLRIRTAVIGGISMGAGVAIRFAVEWPERVKALILVRPAWLDQPDPPQLRLFVRIAELLESMGPQDGLAAFQKDSEWVTMRRTAPAMADSLCQQFTVDRAHERRVRLQQMPLASPIEKWSQVENLQKPALVVGNRTDPVHPFEFAEIWAHRLPLAQLVEIPSKSEGAAAHRGAFQCHLAHFLSTIENS